MASVKGAAAVFVAMTSSDSNAARLMLGGASFGLAYAGLLFRPLLHARLGRLSRARLYTLHALTTVVAFAYAGWAVGLA